MISRIRYAVIPAIWLNIDGGVDDNRGAQGRGISRLIISLFVYTSSFVYLRVLIVVWSRAGDTFCEMRTRILGTARTCSRRRKSPVYFPRGFCFRMDMGCRRFSSDTSSPRWRPCFSNHACLLTTLLLVSHLPTVDLYFSQIWYQLDAGPMQLRSTRACLSVVQQSTVKRGVESFRNP
jgi:hypothetical protein